MFFYLHPGDKCRAFGRTYPINRRERLRLRHPRLLNKLPNRFHSREQLLRHITPTKRNRERHQKVHRVALLSVRKCRANVLGTLRAKPL